MEKQKKAESDLPECKLIRPGEAYEGKQGFSYFAGISTESAGARGICMHMLKMPPGGGAKVHKHENHETAIYLLSGKAHTWYGEQLEHNATILSGDYFYIPAGIPHLPYNSYAEECVAIIARTDPNEQESVVLLPELEKIHL